MILGESGAGKSTLLNALLGADALATGAVRERDDMGRHTTVARMMVKLPGAGVICDAPGSGLPLVGHERGLAKAFPEISELAATCRFRDCTHGNEPGCAVREAREAGELDEVRVESYLALANEMRGPARARSTRTWCCRAGVARMRARRPSTDRSGMLPGRFFL